MLAWQIERTGLGYTARLLDVETEGEVCRVLIDDVMKARLGLAARLTVETGIDTARRLHGRRVLTEFLTFTSGRDKTSLARRLDDLIVAPPGAMHIDWEQVVEGLAMEVLDLEFAPIPLRSLASVRARGPISYLVDKLLPVGRATILYGPGGTGKSVLAAALATCLTTGRPFLGFPTRQSGVLYLDWETSAEDVAANVSMVARGLGLPVPDVSYIQMVHPLEARLGQVGRVVTEKNIDLVIIDSAAMASRAGKDSADPADFAIEFYRALRQLNVAALVIDHVTGEDMKKPGAITKPYGSIYKWNSARNAFEVRPSANPGEHRVTVFHRKANLTRRLPDFDVTYNWNDESESVVLNATSDSPLWA